MARTKGSGKKEDEPVLREAFRAFREGAFRTERAAAFEYGKKLPGDPEVNGSRLYRKMRERRAELEAEIASGEEGEGDDDDLIQLAVELAGEPPEVKVKRLTRLFRIAAENANVVESVIRNLREDGVFLNPELLSRLLKVNFYIVINEREMPEYDRKVRNRKWRKNKELQGST